ncbi:MAG: GspH/FimT family pseudopilin [Gammaproteobacteria bacterium]|nr:GspH/FimT family pseudopilin [Gammaproteobacteria bacterium]MDH4253360.1 GspH/FimT family pseudopilin [Gammaproteobacteria bacterium]MDH5310134.1 GspH/FimT family pseudopilin [Gammaproteobacteria bacterium]
MSPPGCQKAYSLFELLMTLALAAIVFGLGLPSLGALVADQRLRAETDALFHAIHRARQESIVRRRVVTICASRDGRACDPDADWSAGWIVFANRDRAALGERRDDETLIQAHAADDTVLLQSNRASFSFRSTHERATNGTVIVCDRRGRAVARAVVVSYTGRPRVARADSRGQPYACAH